MRPVGIHGVGQYLPPQVRGNDWWPEHVVSQWREKAAARLVSGHRMEGEALPDAEGARLTLQAMAAYADDPFKGSRERRVMPEGMLSSEMEVLAAQDALQRSGVDPAEIDLLLVYSQLPDYLTIPTAPQVHRSLGLSEKCFTLCTDAACNAFPLQLALAEQMIRGGQARYGLLIQSTAVSRACKQEDQSSAWFGDGATAVVVGPVPEGRGVLGRAHRTDGSYYRSLVTGCPGTTWYRGDHIEVYSEDPAAARRMLLSVSDLGRQVVDEALAEAGLQREDVRFFATHQAAPWVRQVTQQTCGLSNARSVDTFSWTASLGPCNPPLMLAIGEREGLLQGGDLVAVYTGGGGITWSGVIMRWGR
ncbi:MAG TPA: 3-oxoacyl-[acyl-carrier-protein] synthase III C-terminal domain-containing protein [Myxococcales bacterium]|nr:3-oxoacyl-[acyl-carrier-protein] synthase III C-terminal domain-containing protein [Myxococcales bacterium]